MEKKEEGGTDSYISTNTTISSKKKKKKEKNNPKLSFLSSREWRSDGEFILAHAEFIVTHLFLSFIAIAASCE